MDSDEERLAFILAAQAHCDEYLSRIAEPSGKSVLVLGAGAGTEMLWCLRRGAREVVGIDSARQSREALDRAVGQLGLAPDAPYRLERLAIEEAPSLGRRFDLVLSNNTFEHLLDLDGAFAACARLVAPDAGRIAIFTDPLYYSSVGSHLPLEPWEHLWGEGEAVRRQLLASGLDPRHSLHKMGLQEYLDEEISLNRMRLRDFLDGIATSGLVVLSLGLVRDRHLGELATYREPLAAFSAGAERSAGQEEGSLSANDLTVEGIWAELALIEEGSRRGPAVSFVSVEEQNRHQAKAIRHELELAAQDLRGEICRLYVDSGDGYTQAASLEGRIAEDQERVVVEYDLGSWGEVRSLRWDPTENRICELSLTAVRYRNGKGEERELDVAALQSNAACGEGGWWSFDTLDPMVLLPVAGRVAWLRIEGRRRLVNIESRLAEMREAEAEVGRLHEQRDRLRQDVAQLRAEVAGIQEVVAQIEASPSFRLGRFLTAPARRLRAFFRGPS